MFAAVMSGIVDQPADYLYSSAMNYAKMRLLIAVDIILNSLKPTTCASIQNFDTIFKRSVLSNGQ